MCIFCKILAKELPASIVYEDELTMAFLDIQPINPGHVLVIPKEHAAFLNDLSPKSAQQIMTVGQKIDQALRQSGLKCEGINIFLADGKAAGQEIFHVHLHVFPRFEGDGFGFRFGESYHKHADRKALDQAAADIRKNMPA